VVAGSVENNPFVYMGGLGYWQDADLGLNYVRARWQDPKTGRWLSVDPDLNQLPYQYADNNPVAQADASGETPKDTGGLDPGQFDLSLSKSLLAKDLKPFLIPPRPGMMPHSTGHHSGNSGGRTNHPASISSQIHLYFIFVTQDLPDVGADHGIYVRKFDPGSPAVLVEPGSPLWQQIHPEDFGISAANPGIPDNVTMRALHVLGKEVGEQNTPYISLSDKVYGAATMRGKSILVDVSRLAKKPTIISTDEVVQALEQLKASDTYFDGTTYRPVAPLRSRIDILIHAVKQYEGETLAVGSVPKEAIRSVSEHHQLYIKAARGAYEELQANRITPEQLQSRLSTIEGRYRVVSKLGRAAKVVKVIGITLAAKDIYGAYRESQVKHTNAPLAKEVARQVGGWAGAWAGGVAGGEIGMALGIETGPGAFLTGFVGSTIGGFLGFFGINSIFDGKGETYTVHGVSPGPIGNSAGFAPGTEPNTLAPHRGFGLQSDRYN